MRLSVLSIAAGLIALLTIPHAQADPPAAPSAQADPPPGVYIIGSFNMSNRNRINECVGRDPEPIPGRSSLVPGRLCNVRINQRLDWPYFAYNRDSGKLYYWGASGNLCAEAKLEFNPAFVYVADCTHNDPNQEWTLNPYQGWREDYEVSPRSDPSRYWRTTGYDFDIRLQAKDPKDTWADYVFNLKTFRPEQTPVP